MRRRIAVIAAMATAALLTAAPQSASGSPEGSFTPSVVQSVECLESGEFRWQLVLSVVSTPESTWFVGLGGDLQNFTSVTPTSVTPTTQSITVVGDSDVDVNGAVRFQVFDIGAEPQVVQVTIAAPDCAEPTTTTTTTTVPDQTTTVPTSTAAPTTAAPPTTGSGGVSPSLPTTGSETEWLTLFGLLTLAAGLLAVGYARRPSSS